MIIEVRIPKDRYDGIENAINRGLLVLNKLKEVGVPVKGCLWPEGVDSGSLKTYVDGDSFFGGGDVVYEWSEE